MSLTSRHEVGPLQIQTAYLDCAGLLMLLNLSSINRYLYQTTTKYRHSRNDRRSISTDDITIQASSDGSLSTSAMRMNFMLSRAPSSRTMIVALHILTLAKRAGEVRKGIGLQTTGWMRRLS